MLPSTVETAKIVSCLVQARTLLRTLQHLLRFQRIGSPFLQAEDLLREGLVLEAALKQEPIVPGLLERLLPRRFKQYQKGVSSRT